MGLELAGAAIVLTVGVGLGLLLSLVFPCEECRQRAEALRGVLRSIDRGCEQ